MIRPPAGFCLRVDLVRVVDGDTVIVRLPSSKYEWRIRLIDCWADELKTLKGRAAKAQCETLMKDKVLHVWIPELTHVVELLKNLTFDRIPGYIFIDEDTTLNEEMVRTGYANLHRK
jgi:endonuclease YncB( thermonuclease family)